MGLRFYEPIINTQIRLKKLMMEYNQLNKTNYLIRVEKTMVKSHPYQESVGGHWHTPGWEETGKITYIVSEIIDGSVVELENPIKQSSFIPILTLQDLDDDIISVIRRKARSDTSYKKERNEGDNNEMNTKENLTISEQVIKAEEFKEMVEALTTFISDLEIESYNKFEKKTYNLSKGLDKEMRIACNKLTDAVLDALAKDI